MLHVNLETALRTKEGGKSSHLGSLLRLRCVFDLFCVRKKRVFSFSSICYFVVVLVVVCRSCLSCTSLFFFFCCLFVCFVLFLLRSLSRDRLCMLLKRKEEQLSFFFIRSVHKSKCFFFFILEGAVVVTLRLVSLVRQSTGGTIEKNWSQLLFFLFFFFLMQEKGEKKSLYIYACVHVRVSIGISNFLSLMIVVLFVWFLCFWPPSYPFSLNFFLCFTC